jgi:hypothetical protein|tara:strand:+ start:1739 stop:2128 length:390 start_codon:yes stop_codon:yes gene_type:complete
VDKDNNRSIYRARKLIKNVLTQVIDNPKNPDFLNFFHADTYRFYFLMSFMWEYLEGNEISQEYAISLVPKKYASRIKRLQVLKQAVKLNYISETSSQVDKRRRIYKPTENLLNDFFTYTDNIYINSKAV